MKISDKFHDHFLASSQAAANIIMQLAFLLAAPEIGFLFLTVVFVIFGFAALRMTSQEAAILWGTYGVRCSHNILFLEGSDRPNDGNNVGMVCRSLFSYSDDRRIHLYWVFWKLVAKNTP